MSRGGVVLESLTAAVPCPDCAGEAEWHGVQALVDDSLRWDTEVACRSCGHAVAVCGAELPARLRERMLAEHGPAVLRLAAPVDRGAVMRVLRAALGVGLADVQTVLGRVLAGEYDGTLPETERLARRLRAAGVRAVAVRPRDADRPGDEFPSTPGSVLP